MTWTVKNADLGPAWLRYECSWELDDQELIDNALLRAQAMFLRSVSREDLVQYALTLELALEQAEKDEMERTEIAYQNGFDAGYNKRKQPRVKPYSSPDGDPWWRWY